MRSKLSFSLINESSLLRDIGSLVRKLRKEKGLSGIDLAVELSISQQQISRYESGKSIMSIVMFLKICVVFNITPNEFFTLLYYHRNFI